MWCVARCVRPKRSALVICLHCLCIAGKTLSYQIASDNMKHLGPFYGQLHLVKPWVYQCSETSTAKEIESVYKTALDLYRKHQLSNIKNER